ncbi:hypothetical protein ACRRTK_023413 [Alexandromys fortis]
MTAGSLEDANQPHVLRKTALCHFMHELSMTMVRRCPPEDCACGRHGAPLGDFLNPVDFTVRCTCRGVVLVDADSERTRLACLGRLQVA